MLEHSDELKRFEAKHEAAIRINDSITYLTDAFWSSATGEDTGQAPDWVMTKVSQAEFELKVEHDLHLLIKQILIEAKRFKYDGSLNNWDWEWTSARALLFTISVMTTVGYGDVVPTTISGFFFLIGFALLGIALMMLFLAKCGSALAKSVRYLYRYDVRGLSFSSLPCPRSQSCSRCCCRPCRAARKESETPARFMRRRLHNRLIDEVVGQETWMPTSNLAVPPVLSIGLLFSYVIMGAFIFSSWEGWTFVDSVYFVFVTLTTIGIGDFVPKKSFLASKSTSGAMRSMITVVYCIFGNFLGCIRSKT